ncbi:hypothetical protein FH972_021120 [Carpinus fangiana]|uniref:Uncharacterized protein n=1 Tax=Carpinus fangiana TaxID=176857 RepID=A0A5N6KNG7_9ROSI|nr:hypothetical protein FH972_021120 [Carpinus fangiana]
MGVTGLWTVVQPCARPIKIETLNKKRLAVDASIWVYQFLKAVRDKEGNALRNSHVVGFFRRICKLLFFGIRPVFVFDGGAPVLKRQTVAGRKSRREGRREDAVRTAGKLLALQMQRRAEEDEAERKRARAHPADAKDEEPLPEKLVYVDELALTEKERAANRKFKRKDQYHLPDLDMPLAEMGAPDDPRVMSMEELETYARQFESGEDINVYDFSKIDFNSPFFTSLPASDRYNILNAARLRSRLRMGYSKDQLDKMFPDRMAFSRFQIERVAERNELTSRLMNINGMGDDPTFDGSGRVAGEKGREYVLVKNPGVEGGWALGVIGDRDKDEGKRDKPINIDELDRKAKEDEEANAADEREEQPSELPEEEIEKRRRAFYDSRKDAIKTRKRDSNVNAMETTTEEARGIDFDDTNDLFVGDANEAAAVRMLAERGDDDSGDDEELQRAIAMSLGQEDSSGNDDAELSKFDPSTFKQQKATDFNPFSNASNGRVAQVANNRARRAAPAAKSDNSDDDDDDMDLAGALAESRRAKEIPTEASKQQDKMTRKSNIRLADLSSNKEAPKEKHNGPLPFEKLDLGSSLLGKKRMEEIQEEQAGGFEKDDDKPKPPKPLPPWFSKEDAVKDDVNAQKAVEEEDRRREREASDERFEFEKNRPTLRKQQTGEVIDVDALDAKANEIIDLDADVHEEFDAETRTAQHISTDQVTPEEKGTARVDSELRMDDLADKVRAEPPSSLPEPTAKLNPRRGPFEESDSEEEQEGSIEWEPSDNEQEQEKQEGSVRATSESPDDVYVPTDILDDENPQSSVKQQTSNSTSPAIEPESRKEDRLYAEREAVIEQAGDVDKADESDDDVFIPDEAFFTNPEASADNMVVDDDPDIMPASGLADEDTTGVDLTADVEDDEEAVYSDPEDEELFISLANEAEEHARFASTFNQKTQRQNIEEYERELKALRTQQKKDRRDADEVTQVMITECQQLLKMFGLPYITAPMEAEAQCAELVKLGLVDGIVTDDSDTFLFGGTRIYKNMFNQAKFVECYLAADLEKEFDLTREKLVRIAHLLGSDYTEGLPGIGPVNALEIISEFAEGLQEFKSWWGEVQSGSRQPKEEKGFRKKFSKSNKTKLFLPTAFPDLRVDEAYLHPEVDSDPSPFQWGVPDLDALRSFLMATIGWSQERTDEVLVPVIRDMNRRENEGTQANITNFITGGAGAGAFAPRVRGEGKSKRMEGALERMAERAKKKRKGGDADLDRELEIVETAPGTDTDTADPDLHTTDSSQHKGKKGNHKLRQAADAAQSSLAPADGRIPAGDDEEASLVAFQSPVKKKRKSAR